MARDDYHVIAYKVLLYLYACIQRKIVFDDMAFRKAAGADKINEEYFEDVLRMLQDEGYISGLVYAGAWGSLKIRANDLCDAEITPAGIAYLTENSRMSAAKKVLIDTADIAASLIGIVGI